ncbi:alpha beta hydrolase fold [Trichoderma arundinaceum]|uniref:Alpha beta hydrolase fold n=1 Tax=Trichoderma arundinaceum TaxID=490622 RepID=A0A395NYG9_TRIAR|nr:alpha beta hydrolase fold [Trichoderma arundinaceum]
MYRPIQFPAPSQSIAHGYFWVRAVLGVLTAQEIQTILPSTEESYRIWVRRKEKLTKSPDLKERIQCDIQPLPEGGSSILWVGNRHKARKVVLFLHGGGYVMPSQVGHFECVWNTFILSGVESGTEVAVAFLQYSLAPTWKAPVQLRQAASALSEILNAGFSAKDIVIGGDSAGGNLTMQLLHHIVDPHAEACRISLQEPLAAAILVSPWLSSDFSSSSFIENETNDMLSKSIMSSLKADTWVREEESSSDGQSSWIEPLDWKGAWLNKVDSAVRKIHITVGEREVLSDQGKLMAKTITSLQTGVEVSLESDPKAAHDLIVAEGMLEQIGEATIRMKQWFKGLL